MDSVLLWSWKSGLDLQTVAAELGLDVRTLLLRVQVLADDGLLTPTVPPVHGGPATTPYPAYASAASTDPSWRRLTGPENPAEYASAAPAPSPAAVSDLTPYPPTVTRRASGRHRRRHESAYTAYFGPSTTTFPTYTPH
jgi:hypothetical protein